MVYLFATKPFIFNLYNSYFYNNDNISMVTKNEKTYVKLLSIEVKIVCSNLIQKIGYYTS